MKSTLRDNEKIIKEGAANLQKGLETVGGRLYLTNERIIFEAHFLNFQSGIDEISIAHVKSTTAGWTKLLGIVPILPNLIFVQTKTDEEYSFVVFGRDSWIAAITSVANFRKAQ